MEYYLVISMFIFGTVVGSFLNVITLRLPRGKSIGGRSRCMSCNRVLAWWELFPLASYLLLRGRCRRCGKKISPRYAAVEGAAGLLFSLAYLRLEPASAASAIVFVSWLTFISLCICVFVIDLEHFLIFDALVIPGTLAVLALGTVAGALEGQRSFSFNSHLVSGLLGAAAGALPFYFLWYVSKGEWMGFGDVKLMLLIGAMLGVQAVWVAVLLAVFSGGLVSVLLLLFSEKTLKSKIPFGAFLAPAAVAALFYGKQVLNWYLSLLLF